MALDVLFANLPWFSAEIGYAEIYGRTSVQVPQIEDVRRGF